MTQTTVRKSKWFWPWQDDQEEAWLEKMSQQGLHLKQAYILGWYDFIQGQPQNCVYRLDFQDSLKKNKEAYLRLFIDTGWEYLGEKGGWQYFRKLAEPGSETEIYTDPDTKIQKYKRYLTYLGVINPSYLVVFVAFWGTWPEWMMWLNVGVIILSSIFSIVISVKITERIKQLKALQ
jgi:hypothetical protein